MIATTNLHCEILCWKHLYTEKQSVFLQKPIYRWPLSNKNFLKESVEARIILSNSIINAVLMELHAKLYLRMCAFIIIIILNDLVIPILRMGKKAKRVHVHSSDWPPVIFKQVKLISLLYMRDCLYCNTVVRHFVPVVLQSSTNKF